MPWLLLLCILLESTVEYASAGIYVYPETLLLVAGE